MSEKKIFVLVRNTTDISTGIVTTSFTGIHFSKTEAHRAMRDFVCEQLADPSAFVSGNNMIMTGMQKRRGGETGLRWFVRIDQHIIDDYDLVDASKPYTVEVEVIRTYNVTIEVDEASDETDAREKALEVIKDGESEDQLEQFDDQDLTVEDCYES
jgi:hypothetical protein